jgi:hypothetical protein
MAPGGQAGTPPGGPPLPFEAAACCLPNIRPGPGLVARW